MKISHYILSYLRLDKRIFCPRYDGVYYAYTFGSNDFCKFDHFMFEITGMVFKFEFISGEGLYGKLTLIKNNKCVGELMMPYEDGTLLSDITGFEFFEWLYQHQNIVFPLMDSHDWQFIRVGF